MVAFSLRYHQRSSNGFFNPTRIGDFNPTDIGVFSPTVIGYFNPTLTPAVTLQLEVGNGVDKNDQPKTKNISYEKLSTDATAEKLAELGKEFGGLMDEAPKGMYVVERHSLEEAA